MGDAGMRRILIIVPCALALCIPALAQTVESYPGAPEYVGNPDTVYCRMPRMMPGSRIQPVCMTNAEWARYPGYGMSPKEVEGTPNFNHAFYNGYFVDRPLAHPLVGPTQP